MSSRLRHVPWLLPPLPPPVSVPLPPQAKIGLENPQHLQSDQLPQPGLGHMPGRLWSVAVVGIKHVSLTSLNIWIDEKPIGAKFQYCCNLS